MSEGRTVDVLVVGGGVTGAGVALDAASRGLSVCLIEVHDLAFGTSRWSSKLVHGGLRYLAKGDIGLARESAAEREVLMNVTAPHLTHPMAQLIPLHSTVSGVSAAVTMAGLRTGDALRVAARTPSVVLPPPRRVPAAEAVALAPGLRGGGLRGGLLSFDGRLTDDARLVVALARTAASYGARIITRARATAMDGSGAAARDELTGEAFTVRARTVVNATGVWAGELVDSVRLRPSRGTHVVLDAADVGITATALTIPVPGEFGRYALLLPQHDGRVYLGLTDEPVEGAVPDVPEPPQSDVDQLLGLANGVLDTTLGRQHVRGAFAGLRPLLQADGRSADLSRHHGVLHAPNGVVTVVGGKLTTYRKMAQDAVDAAVGSRIPDTPPSRTERLPLVGALPREKLGSIDAPRRLVARYGTEAPRIAALAATDAELARPVSGEITGAEVVWAVRHEGALEASDVLDRRTRVGLVTADRDAAEPAVTDIVTRALAGLGS